MALQKCKDCGREVSHKAKRCPNCGAPVKKKPVFAIILFTFLLLSLIGYLYGTKTAERKRPKQAVANTEVIHFTDPCQEHVEITHDAFVRNLWEKTTAEGRGRMIGKVLPGSRAIILDENAEDFKIISPLDQSVGWINKMQVGRTLFQDINTLQPCDG